MIRIASAVVALTVVSFANCQPMNAASGSPVVGSAGILLDDAALGELSRLALEGSGEAARRLSTHYLMARNDRSQAVYWALISAENGDVGGQYYVGYLLKDDPDAKNRKRAIFWLSKAASQGSGIAQRLLREITPKQ